ncbi:hypothetical protein Tco_0987091 [Tanacetum coccineum]
MWLIDDVLMVGIGIDIDQFKVAKLVCSRSSYYDVTTVISRLHRDKTAEEKAADIEWFEAVDDEVMVFIDRYLMLLMMFPSVRVIWKQQLLVNRHAHRYYYDCICCESTNNSRFYYVYTADIRSLVWHGTKEIYLREVLFHSEMITSQLQGKLWLYDEVRTPTLFVLSSSNRTIVGNLRLMRQNK